ncbi:hypothetical protein HHK36_011495 [Tetracentron sinense]|uniref:Uncharacterized protein n=1 Tax=Tetracentron sinense TaxID=13715 RepID=A0A835DH94_TETSI|nr:hypothetical protein HHK36_011495 [Tetracentron sinense]
MKSMEFDNEEMDYIEEVNVNEEVQIYEMGEHEGDEQYEFENKDHDYHDTGDEYDNYDDDNDENTPSTVLWSHVVKSRKSGHGWGGSLVFKCKHCKNVYHGSYTRVYSHLIEKKKGEASKGVRFCSVVMKNRNLQQKIKRQVERAESLPQTKPLKKSSLDRSSPTPVHNSMSTRSPLVRSFKTQERENIDYKVIKHPLMRRLEQFSDEKKRVKRLLDPFTEKWPTNGLSIVSDGWTNVKNRPLINILASNAFGSMFLYAHDFSSVEKSGKNISDFLLAAIENVGPSNVVQVITDNATNCKTAGHEVTKWFQMLGKVGHKHAQMRRQGIQQQILRSMSCHIRDNLRGKDELFSIVEKIVIERWEKMNVPLHCFAHALTPKYYNLDYLHLPTPGGGKRIPPDQDNNILDGVLEALSKITQDEAQADIVRKQYFSFVGKKERFSTIAVIRDAKNSQVDVLEWWQFHGGSTLQLRNIAIKVLSQSVSTTSAERVWSTYSYIHSVKRNRLNSTRANSLVYIHSNLRLLSRYIF